MKIIIDINADDYNEITTDAKNTPRNLTYYERRIAEGTPLCEITTRIENEIKKGNDAEYSEFRAGLRQALAIISEFEEK